MRPSTLFSLILAALFYFSSVVISAPTPASPVDGVGATLAERGSSGNSAESSNPAAAGGLGAR
ncbi:hypothetical protein FRC07_012154, partial [Ceratobasidium sp. 392]